MGNRNQGRSRMQATYSFESRAARIGLTMLAAVWLSMLGAAIAVAQTGRHHHKAERSDCRDPTLACASTATPSFATDGTLWLAFTAADRILVVRSVDLGRSFSTATPVTPEPQQLDWGPDARPKIVVHKDGGISVAYA